jgi:DNA-binding CsgD family transcriptional regulator
MGSKAGTDLLEREEELLALQEMLAGARSGSGTVCFVEAPPGAGKTSLLEAGCAFAPHEAIVLRARGQDLERGFAFGVVRQLFDRLMRSLPEQRRQDLRQGAAALGAPVVGLTEPGAPVAPGFAVLHGLYWLVAGIADERPLVLAVDDAQWSDVESLRFLAFLAPRVEELPVLLMVAAREYATGTNGELLTVISGLPATRTLRPRPLSEEAVRELLGRRPGPEPAPAFAAACHQAVGGNPLLLDQLLAELNGQGIEPTEEQAPQIARLTPRAVTRSIMTRLGSLPKAAADVARAVAVLGDGAELRHAAALAGIAIASAATGADDLITAALLLPGAKLSFVHPIFRESVYGEFQAHTRAAAHERAAAMLAEEGAPLERVGSHLLATDPAGNPTTVDQLRLAAHDARGRGATDPAIAFLRRALEEPPPPDVRSEVLSELGRVEVAALDPAAPEHLLAAIELTESPEARAEAALFAAHALLMGERPGEGARILGEVADGLRPSGGEIALLLDASRLAWIRHGPGVAWSTEDVARLDEIRRERPPVDDLGRLASVLAAWDVVLRAGPLTEAAGLAREGLEGATDNPLLQPDQFGWGIAAWTCSCCELFDLHDAIADVLLPRERQHGSIFGTGQILQWRGEGRFRRGDLADAETDHRELLELTDSAGWRVAHTAGVGFLLAALAERDEFDAGEAELRATGELEAPEPILPLTFTRDARGRFRLAQGRPREALVDLLEAGRVYTQGGFHNPAVSPWRSQAALAHHALGDEENARCLAAEELELARAFGAPRTVGVALRAAGLVEGGERGLELLHAAVETLASSPARLEHARALVDLGATLRRLNRRSEARGPLTDGIELAHRCGATALVARGGEELLATGARPRSLVFTGVDALTASERRVARMAAAGVPNLEIAQALFVTRKTVETHLSAAYRKLDVTGRRDLAEKFASPVQ